MDVRPLMMFGSVAALLAALSALALASLSQAKAFGLLNALEHGLAVGFMSSALYALHLWWVGRYRWHQLKLFALGLMLCLTCLAHQALQADPLAGDAWAWLLANAGLWLVLTCFLYLEEMHGFPVPGLRWALVLGALVWALCSAWGVNLLSSMQALGGSPAALAALVVSAHAMVSGVRGLRARGLGGVRTSFYHPGVRRKDASAAARYRAAMCVLGPALVLSGAAVDRAWQGTDGAPHMAVLVLAMQLHAHFLVVMWQGWVQMMEAAERARRESAIRLQAKQAQLEAVHAQLSADMQDQAVAAERERIRRELHDGLGASMQAAIQRLYQGGMTQTEVLAVLKHGVDDLYLSIDSVEMVAPDLLLLLAVLRYRLGSRLEAAGVAVQWEVQDVPHLPWLDPSSALTVLHILQEFVHNTLTYAGATSLSLRTWEEVGYVVVQLHDDGVGFEADAALTGHPQGGMQRQRRWAASLGARIEWTQHTGVAMRLYLPRQEAQ